METTDDLRKFVEAHHASPEALAETEASLARADLNPRRHHWRIALYLTTLLVSLPMLVHSTRQFGEFAATNQYISPEFASKLPGFDLAARLTPAQKLLLWGDKQAADSGDRWKSLWQSEPANPAFLLNYAADYSRFYPDLSPEILDAAVRIDPDNAWYLAVQASAKAKKAVKKQSPGYDARKRGAKTTYTVTDEKEFAAALGIFHQAARQPRLSVNQVDLQRQRFALLPERRDFVSQFPAQVIAASQNCALIDLRWLVDVISVQAGRCAERKDVAGFQQLLADWRWLVRAAARDGVSLLDVMVAKALFTMPLREFSDAAKALGLEEDAEKFAALYQQHEDRRKFRDDEVSALIETKSSIMTWLTLMAGRRQADAPPPITEADLRPGRYADHAVFGRAHALASWAILGLCAGLAALSSSRGDPSVIRLSKRLQDLFRSNDWVWILGGGVVVPVLWYFAITRLTPFSAREWSMRPSGFLLPAAQLGSLTILILVASAVIASGRLATRAGFLGLKPRLPWLGWLAVISAALAIPLVGALFRPLGNMLFFTGCTLGGLALLWWFWGFASLTLGKRTLRRATLARMMVPAWIFGMLTFALLMPVHYAEERHWIQQDRLLEITAESPAMTRYEHDLTEVLRRELMGKLD